MIFLFCHNGQLCNKLWSIVNFVAYAQYNNLKVKLFFFDEYIDLFPLLKTSSLIKRSSFSYWLFSITKNHGVYFMMVKLIPFILNKTRLLSNIDFKNIDSTKISLYDGWLCRYQKIDISRTIASTLFQFETKIEHKVDSFLNSLKNDKSKIIGIHMRRGDYKFYRNGKYYYSNEEYMIVIKKIIELRSDVNFIFILCSNEYVDLNYFRNQCNAYIIKDSSAIMDLYALSKCDYIIGPPSTYSQWASFIGGVPLKILFSLETSVCLESFKVIGSLDKYIDNTSIYDFKKP